MSKKNFIITLVIICLIAISAVYFLTKKPKSNEVNVNINTNIVIAEKDLPADRIEVIHFHGTHQCFSCITVGKLSLQTIKDKFPAEYKTGKIVFKDINSDLPENKELANKYGAVGSALYFNKVVDKQDNFEEDAEVWRLVTNEEKYLVYFEEKIKTLINNI
ncbi:MAG: nitrophenyl compound nitroreductase subunit ArsF family protein [Patescibacteria group bacterium]